MFKDLIKLYGKEGVGAVLLFFFLYQFHGMMEADKQVKYLAIEKMENMKEKQMEHDIKLAEKKLKLQYMDFRVTKLEGE